VLTHYLGDVGTALKRATPEKLAALYTSLNLEMTYHPDDRWWSTWRSRHLRVANVSQGC
jgi:hypothetical protein